MILSYTQILPYVKQIELRVELGTMLKRQQPIQTTKTTKYREKYYHKRNVRIGQRCRKLTVSLAISYTVLCLMHNKNKWVITRKTQKQ